MKFSRWAYGVILPVMISVTAHAAEDVERTIMKCRTNSLSSAEQITCLEDALRNVSLPGEQPDWAGIGSIGKPPSVPPGAISSSGVTGLGAEQVEAEGIERQQAEEKSRASEQARVVDFAYNQNEKLVLVLNNGQVWIQRSSDLVGVRLQTGDQPEVLIRRGAISGYRMEFPTYERTITVHRVK